MVIKLGEYAYSKLMMNYLSFPSFIISLKIRKKYTILFEFFKLKFPTLSVAHNLAVSFDGVKGLGPAIKTCLPNSVYVAE